MTAQLLQQLEIESLLTTPSAQSPSTSKPNWTVAEYFSGIGLFRLALENAGWNIIFANDISPEKQQMYADQFAPDTASHHLGDIFDLPTQTIPKTLLATASFPCIDLSLAGNLKGLNGKHSSAFWGLINILEQQGSNRPPLVLIENVPGWLNSNQGKDFRLTVQSLNQLGYHCDVYALNAANFVPQSRERIFLIGIQQQSSSEPEPASIEHFHQRPKSLATTKLRASVLENLDMDWQFLDVPTPPIHTVSINSIVEPIPASDPCWWNPDKVEHHLNMMDTSHLNRVQTLAQAKQLSYRTLYRRRRNGQQRAEVRRDAIAGCLRTAKGGSSRQMLVQMGYGKIQMRAMTPREYARLQGVPDDYPIRVNPIQAINGFGDAVCVPVVEWLAHHVLNPLAQNLLTQNLLR